jgi:hypothetical protein
MEAFTGFIYILQLLLISGWFLLLLEGMIVVSLIFFLLCVGVGIYEAYFNPNDCKKPA